MNTTHDRSSRWHLQQLDLTWPDEYAMIGLTIKVSLSLDGAIVLACWLQSGKSACLICSQASGCIWETHNSTPTHLPAANPGLLPVHRTYPIPAVTWTLEPMGASWDVILGDEAGSCPLGLSGYQSSQYCRVKLNDGLETSQLGRVLTALTVWSSGKDDTYVPCIVSI